MQMELIDKKQYPRRHRPHNIDPQELQTYPSWYDFTLQEIPRAIYHQIIILDPAKPKILKTIGPRTYIYFLSPNSIKQSNFSL